MSDIITLPFPLLDDTDCYRNVGGVFGNGPLMQVIVAELFSVVRPWKECVVHFPDSPPWRPIDPDFACYSVVTRAKENAVPSRDRAKVTRPWPAEVRPVWRSPVNAEPVDFVTQLEMEYDSELNDERRINKEYVTKGMLGLTVPTERRTSSDLEAEIARWSGAHSQIKFDAGPFWTKKGWLPAPEANHWQYIARQYADPTEVDLIAAFSRMLYWSTVFNEKVERACGARGKACRAYQAAAIYRTYYLVGRRISTTEIICADIVIEAVQRHLRRDGRIDWTARTAVLDMLEGASDRAAAAKHGLHHRSLQERYDAETLGIEAKLGRYCQKYEPRQKRPIECYNRSVGARKSAKPRAWRMCRAERSKLVDRYLAGAKTVYSWLDDNFVAYPRIMYRGGALRIIVKYLNLRALPRKAYQLIAEYLERGGKILKAGAVYNGDAPYRKDTRSAKQVMADRFGEAPGPDPFELFDQPKPHRLRDDVEYGVDEKISGIPLFN